MIISQKIQVTASERYKTPIKCPKCNRVLGCLKELDGKMKVHYICQKCGDVEVSFMGRHLE